jgi:hypothetical protein
MSAHYNRALKLFIQCGDREIDAAIEVVGKSQSEGLTHQLIDFLVGETDGVPKDPNYIYRLYMALKKYDDAAKTALIIARQEQDMGNYALAHSVVFETIRKLEDAGIKVNLQLRQTFVLLHSYILGRYYVGLKDDNYASRLFLRVAQSVSKFPQHMIGILTTTVIVCSRAGLKSQGHEYALMLMRPENRPNIRPEEVKRNIEKIVRRRPSPDEDKPEDLTACPISAQLIPASQLECPTTRDSLPMCVVTGRHMVLEDWCFCPVSKFPALYSAYIEYINTYPAKKRQEGQDGDSKDGDDAPTSSYGKGRNNVNRTALDPVLGQPVTVNDLKLSKPEDAQKYIRIYNNVFEEKKQTEEDDNEETNAVGIADAENSATNIQLDGDWNGNGGNVNPMHGNEGRLPAKQQQLMMTKSPAKRSKARGEGGSELMVRPGASGPGGEARDRDRDRDREPRNTRDVREARERDAEKKVPSPRNRDRDREQGRERERDSRDRERMSKRPDK